MMQGLRLIESSSKEVGLDKFQELKIVLSRILAVRGDIWNILGLQICQLEIATACVSIVRSVLPQDTPIKVNAIKVILDNEIDHIFGKNPDNNENLSG